MLLILGMGLWGLSWTNGRVLGRYEVPAAVLMFWRFTIAAIAMVPVVLTRKHTFALRGKTWLAVAAGGGFLALYNYFYFTGTRLGLAGAGGVLVTTLNPVVTFLLVLLWTRKRAGRIDLIGIILGVIGGLIILKIWQQDWQAMTQSGNLYFLGCAVSWAFLTLVTSAMQRQLSTLQFSFWVYLIAAVISLFFIPAGGHFKVFRQDAVFWWNLISISLGAMAFATTIYFLAAMELGSQRAAAFIFTVPLSALLFSMILLGEPFDPFVVGGGSLSIIAVYLLNHSSDRKKGVPAS